MEGFFAEEPMELPMQCGYDPSQQLFEYLTLVQTISHENNQTHLVCVENVAVMHDVMERVLYKEEPVEEDPVHPMEDDPMELIEEETVHAVEPFKRPRRAAAIKASKNIKQVLKWERCKESSTMFKTAACEINKEFDRVARATKKQNFVRLAVPNSSTPESSVRISSTHSSIEHLSNPNPAEDATAGDVCSDDECTALKSDVEDNDEDSDDSDAGSLDSFVVGDDYMSDAEGCESACKKTKYESQSDSESEEDESSSDEDDDSVKLDDDSDADASMNSESDMDSDASVDGPVEEEIDSSVMDTHAVESTGNVEQEELVDDLPFEPVHDVYDGQSPTNVADLFHCD